jgi:hypothetical protein
MCSQCSADLTRRARLECENAINQKVTVAVHPVQTKQVRNAACPQAVTMRAYEVYCALYGEQEAMVTGGCRGGFSVGELIAFLYAYSFPRDEWRKRVNEAFHGMNL